MLTNSGAEVESPPVSDESTAPPDWYTDPDDESQYRYWDGSAWTEHRAPRHVVEETPALRGVNRLIADSLRILRRQWRGWIFVALLSVVAYVLVAVLFVYSADLVLNGELDEIIERISEPGFDPETPENEAYFESLEVDLSIWNFVPAVLGALFAWFVSNLVTAAITLLTLADERGDDQRHSAVLTKALKRVPRLIGVDLQFVVLVAAVSAVTLLVAATVPLMLIVVIPVLIVAGIWGLPVAFLAYVVASIGPAQWSLGYAYRLVRGRFRATFGRLLLLLVIVTVFAVMTELVAGQLGLSWVLSDVLIGAVSTVLSLLLSIATAIVYLDLGGESD